MRIYQLYPAENAARITMLTDSELVRSAINDPQLLPPECQLRATEQVFEDEAPQEMGDVAFVEHTRSLIAFSAALYEKLLTVTEVGAQWIPINIDGKSYYLMNIADVIQAIDTHRSTMNSIDLGDGTFHVSADELVFREDVIGTRWIFRDKITESKACICTDQFFSWFNDNNFTGMHFKPVYDSNYEPFKLSPGTKDALARPDIFGPKGISPSHPHLWTNE